MDRRLVRKKKRGKNSLSGIPATKDKVKGGRPRQRESEIMKRPERGQRLPGTVEFMLDLSLFMEQLAVNGKMEWRLTVGWQIADASIGVQRKQPSLSAPLFQRCPMKAAPLYCNALAPGIVSLSMCPARASTRRTPVPSLGPLLVKSLKSSFQGAFPLRPVPSLSERHEKQHSEIPLPVYWGKMNVFIGKETVAFQN